MKKLFRITTIPLSLNLLLKNQLLFLNQYFKITAVSSAGKELYIVRDREKVDTISLNMEREISPLKDLISLVRLGKLFLKQSPDIVHANTPKASLLSMISALLARVPYRLYTVTGLRFETEKGIKRWILIWMERITCLCATHVIAESKGVEKMIYLYKLTKKKTFIIGNGNINGVDHYFWDPSKIESAFKKQLKVQYNISENDFVFIFVGRLVTDKGVNELIQAFKALNMNNSIFKLLLVGPREDLLDPLNAESLESLKGNPSIISVGYQEDVRSFLSISNVLVLPSYREGFPNVILQAGAMMVPCIATNVNGVEDVIDGKNGKIIDKRNVLQLKEAMLNMYISYDAIDKSYCREKVLMNYSQDFYFPELLRFYQEIIN